MKNIVLICGGGMSSSILEHRMQEVAKALGYECEVHAYGVTQIDKVAPLADIILIGPQIRFYLSKIRQSYPDKIIEVMDMRDYGSMNGEKILNHAYTQMNKKNP